MSDRPTRELEREAATGDPQAVERLKRDRCRRQECCAGHAVPVMEIGKFDRECFMVINTGGGGKPGPIPSWSDYVRRDLIERVVDECGEPWPVLRNMGYRCHKVRITVVGKRG